MARPDHIARVYGVPPAEFTATRNRLAAELRKSGHADAARVLADLRKPSAALWAVNRLARTEGKSLGAFFDAVARLRRSQLRDPREAAEALRAQRAALESLVARGREVLTGAGLTASQQALRRLSDTLMGAAVDQDHADALRRGELTTELPAPGFEAFSAARIPARPRLRLVRAPEAPAAPTVYREAVAARAAAAQRRRALEAEDLARRAADHAREVSELEAEKGSARARVADLDRKLRMARKAARQAAAAAKRARAKSGST
jgi:hypothetical protein